MRRRRRWVDRVSVAILARALALVYHVRAAHELRAEMPAFAARPLEIERELVGMIREQIGPVAAFKTAKVVQRLPKTRSGKVLRGTMRKIADGEEWRMPATIDDPVILDEITEALRDAGFAKDAK